MGGEELQVDKWQIDIALGGSQKVISAPPGLTIASISTEAYQAMTERKAPSQVFIVISLLLKIIMKKMVSIYHANF